MSGLKSVVSLRPAGADRAGDADGQVERAARLQRRAERELAARHEAERLLESKSLELFAANQRLVQLNADLESRVEARTRQLDEARRAAVEIGTTDSLTGIANRYFYSNWLERSLARAEGDRGATGLLLIDLDGFKQINDSYGHRHGDQLLVTIADRLHRVAGRDDLVARIGGDEFAVIVEGSDAAAVRAAAARFSTVFDASVTIDGVTIHAAGSLGLAIGPDHCHNAVDLQRFADLALYKSKSEGTRAIVEFVPALLHAYEYRQRMEAEFRVALDGGAIDLVYQPIVCLRTGEIEAIEALARWCDSNGAQVSPAYFIPLAEECGIIRGVGRTLLEKALLETRPWFDSGRIERVSFNVSPLEFLDEGFSDAVIATLDRIGVDPCRLLLEITEGVVIQSLAMVEKVMVRLRAHGVKFALDDFGCGYSDLSTLRKLPICVLKIDRSLLVDADVDDAARIILRNVVSLCRDLGILSICEGAETSAQVDFLRRIDCDYVQGFATGRPATIDQLNRLLGRPAPVAAPLRDVG
jgi:diguanylate cyclase (GGDEF)-like protein